MSPLARTLVALFLAMFALAARAATDKAETIDVAADLSVSPEGRIVKLDFLQELSPELERFLRERVQTWAIKPARRNGRAVGGDTTLYLRLSLEPAGDDVIVRVAKAYTGPRYGETRPPIYPRGAIDTRRQAIVLVTVDVRADGTVGAMSSRMVAGRGFEKAFIGAAERSVREWRFVPERVDGVPVATRAQVPIEFRLPSMKPLAMPKLDADQPPGPNELLADSEFELESDVVGRRL